jgi:hypothetical protein
MTTVPLVVLMLLLGGHPVSADEPKTSAIPGTIPEPPRFGFKPVDEGDALRDFEPSTRDTGHPRGDRGSPAYPATPNDVPHAQRRGVGVERLPDLQTYGRNPQIRRYGTASGSDGIPRGVRPVPARPQGR